MEGENEKAIQEAADNLYHFLEFAYRDFLEKERKKWERLWQVEKNRMKASRLLDDPDGRMGLS